ncbi:t-SNARE [Polychytrium aggregatum]|uniref:t-SNARE n=1 Tax=Polychytrium aggregatum TaxID=110093 RepID=UPI0022FDEF9C|nr:t-SNARE [Polychytrium aggregatum]KAI9209790.1 t-SNARE [Polychytrium aggregatum]
MATRSRTVLFLQYRNTLGRSKRPFPAAVRPSIDASESAGLISNEQSEVVVQMSILPPKWVDVVDEVEEVIGRIKEKLTTLQALQKKHLMPGFDDNLEDEETIERLNETIAKMFQDCKKKINKVHSEQKATDETAQTKVLGKNIQTALATKLQDLSTTYRKIQSSYLNKLRGRKNKSSTVFTAEENPEDEDLDVVFTDAQLAVVADNERVISQRERDINEIVKSIQGLAHIFQELQTMVIDQGTILDRIDYNIEQVAVHVEKAHGELTKVGTRGESRIGFHARTAETMCVGCPG